MLSITLLRLASIGMRAASWRVAGHPFQSPGQRSKKELLRRIFAGFIIGRHAALDRECLMTLDQRLYRAAFPSLELVTF